MSILTFSFFSLVVQHKVLGSLQHPLLVTLLGVCPEALSFVYEYLPSGSVQDYLLRKNSLLPLTWNIRARACWIAEIATALSSYILAGRTGVGLAGEVRRAVSFGKLYSILDSSAGEWNSTVAHDWLNWDCNAAN
ncbi:hypothetical protein GLYMA_12G063300v4 [Glycine max]|uniref:RING-type E3 ubiquitin transferase n=2 Tax=Glycine subgen. Soja TaxID=1462606 RepID=A0A0R0H1X9_SOYBN|nr:hypothetical protein GYH30_032880 [Glycine max]KRH24798.1 hypothetical protein GLYMA_12G063300v4 [Glycine max]RZB74586.1 U-box domain-containing protein 33 [Glycine soja]